MQIRKQQKTIFTFFFIFVMLFGMCFDAYEADSFLSCAASLSDHAQEASLEDYDGVSLSDDFCLEAVRSRQPSASSQKNKSRRSVAFLFLRLLPLLFSSILLSDISKLLPDTGNTSVIIRYIHHKDGKKSAPSFICIP